MFRKKIIGMISLLLLLASLGLSIEEISFAEMKNIKGQGCKLCWTDGNDCESSNPPGWPPLFDNCSVCPVRAGGKSCVNTDEGPGCAEWYIPCGPGISGYSLWDDKAIPPAYMCFAMSRDYPCGGIIKQCIDF